MAQCSTCQFGLASSLSPSLLFFCPRASNSLRSCPRLFLSDFLQFIIDESSTKPSNWSVEFWTLKKREGSIGLARGFAVYLLILNLFQKEAKLHLHGLDEQWLSENGSLCVLMNKVTYAGQMYLFFGIGHLNEDTYKGSSERLTQVD